MSSRIWNIDNGIVEGFDLSSALFGHIHPSIAGIFTVFGLGLIEGRVLHKGAWVVTLLGTLLGVQYYKKVISP